MSRKRWTGQEIRLLRSLFAQGLRGAKQMAPHFPGKEERRISNKLSWLGLVDKQKSDRAKKRKVLDNRTHREFRKFLKENVQHLPPIELTRRWNSTCDIAGLSKVTHDHTRYLLRKMKVRLTAEEARTNRSYTAAYRRMRRQAAQTGRKTADKSAEARRVLLAQRRDKIFEAWPKIPRHRCVRCDEDWPLTEEFFRMHDGSLEMTACRQCINDTRRRLSRLRRDKGDTNEIMADLKKKKRAKADKKWEAVIFAAKELRRKLFREKPNCARQNCICCQEIWPKQKEFFAPPGKDGTDFSRICRFCLRDFKRRIARAEADRESALPIKQEREKFVVRARDLERKRRRKALRRKAQEEKAVERRKCPGCRERWPFTKEYWYVRTYRTESGVSQCLDKSHCRCCVNEADVRRRRGEPSSPES